MLFLKLNNKMFLKAIIRTLFSNPFLFQTLVSINIIEKTLFWLVHVIPSVPLVLSILCDVHS